MRKNAVNVHGIALEILMSENILFSDMFNK